MELRGVELIGRVEPVGSAPRTPEPDPALEVPERLFGEKYSGGAFVPDGTHAWVRLVPEKIVSWDFRKLAGLSRVIVELPARRLPLSFGQFAGSAFNVAPWASTIF